MQKSLSSAIFERELGYEIEPEIFNDQERIKFHESSSPARPEVFREVFGDNEINKTDEIVWIDSIENILITLNCSGQAILYNLLSAHPPKILNHSQEKILKLFYTLQYLILTSITSSRENLTFFLISNASLQTSNPTRVQALPDLQVRLSELVSIHAATYKIIIKMNQSIQIWSLLSNSLEFSFPANPRVSYQYSDNHFIFWRLDKNETKIGVFKLLTHKTIYFNLKTQEKIYFAHILKDSLIIGVNHCRVMKVCLETMDCLAIYDKVPVLLANFQLSGRIFTVFQDGSCMVNFDSNRIVNAEIMSEVSVCEVNDVVVFCDCFGRLGKIHDGELKVVETGLGGVEAMCCNPDTGEIYLVCQGNIYVYE